MKQTRHATLVNAPMVYSGTVRGLRFQPTLAAVTYEYRAGGWHPIRFQPVRVTGPNPPVDARALRPPVESDWYYGLVAALTPPPGIPGFDIEKEST